MLRFTRARTALAFATGAALATATLAEPPSRPLLDLPLEGEQTRPDWVKIPTGDELANEYPPLALMLKQEGSATINCEAETDGRVDSCHVVNETPVGLGFGAAALRLAAYFTMKPGTLDGKPVASAVTIPLAFKTPPGTVAEESIEALVPAVSPVALELARKIAALEDAAARVKATWRVTLDRQAAAIVANGEADSGQIALDALRQGLDETVSDQIDRRAHVLAARMSESDLRATAAYLETQSGRSWTAAESGIEPTDPKAFMARVARAARIHLCGPTACSGSHSLPSSAVASTSH